MWCDTFNFLLAFNLFYWVSFLLITLDIAFIKLKGATRTWSVAGKYPSIWIEFREFFPLRCLCGWQWQYTTWHFHADLSIAGADPEPIVTVSRDRMKEGRREDVGTELPSFPSFPIFCRISPSSSSSVAHFFAEEALSSSFSHHLAWQRRNFSRGLLSLSLSLSFSSHPTSLHACIHGYMHSLDTLSDLSYVADEYDSNLWQPFSELEYSIRLHSWVG